MKHSRARELSMEVIVGAFLFMILLALGVFTIVLSRENLFQPTYRYEIVFPEVFGIREGDSVVLRGVTVGKIRRVEVAEQGVRVEISVERELRLREDYRIEILASSMLGGRFLAIREGSEPAPELAAGEPILGSPPADLIDQATRTVERIQQALDDGRILANLEETMRNVRTLTDSLARGEGTLGRLLADDELYGDLREIASRLAEFSGRLSEPDHSLARLLADEGAVYADIRTIAGNLREATDRINAGEGLLGRLMADDDELYDDLRAAAAALRSVVETVESGEGTLGRLVKEQAMYDEAMLLIAELRATIDDFRETSPITTFTGILFGAF